MDFVAPARKILSTTMPGHFFQPLQWLVPPPYFQDFYFHDENFRPGIDDGYAHATGTSMAAPYVTGIVALMRSSNPLITRGDVYNVLKATASNAGQYNGINHDKRTAWGIPKAGLAMDAVHGRVAGATVKNRLTPMFRADGWSHPDRLYSTRPQVIIAAFSGGYLDTPPHPKITPLMRRYVTDPISSEATVIVGYENFPSINVHYNDMAAPLASFWVFTSDISLWKEVPPNILKPLYRMSFREICEPHHRRSHAYAVTHTEIDTLEAINRCPPGPPTEYMATFRYDGVEGYVLDACPPGYSCNNPSDPSEPQKLYRLHNLTSKMSALLLESQLSLPDFAAYNVWPRVPQPGLTATEIGFAFPNVDSDGDGLPDGMERLYGLNRLSTDSDCDGIPDGVEFPIAGIQAWGHDPLAGGTCP